jgi:peptide deformylase
MAVREIIQPDNPILRQPAEPVTVFDAEFQKLVDDMVETMHDAPGVGLAAPQVAVSKRLFVAQLRDDDDDEDEDESATTRSGTLYVIANPQIVKASPEMVDGTEACLSIPGYYGNVSRHQAIKVKGQNRHGKPIQVNVSGWLARVFQHEIDHLDGRLYTDIATEVWQASPEDETEG